MDTATDAERARVGVLGATGAVGQRLVALLAPHPRFELVTLAGSSDSAGRPYREATPWGLETPIPPGVADVTVVEARPEAVPDLDLLFSSMPSDVAARVEPAFLEAGYTVSSNSSNARLASDVPLVIPEVNPDHLALLEHQAAERDWDGHLVKNPNCSTIAMVPPLAALAAAGYDPARVRVATMQAVSGAGYDGVAAYEIVDNVLPHIGGEEEKMEAESRKLLGEVTAAGVDPHPVDVAASCNRVPTLDGHLESVWVDFVEGSDGDRPDGPGPSVETATEAMRSAPTLDLPSAPDPLVRVHEAPDRPQPRLDRSADGGMSVAVGPLQATETGLQFDCLTHNTLRGAAGASLLNGELLLERGYL
jgi:aspartate-semialdehyde dehydrogenase